MAGTVNSTSIHNGGSYHVATGTIEVTTTAQEFNIVSDSSYVLFCNVENADGVDATSPLVALNSSNGTIGSAAGSVWIDGSTSATYHYTLGYI